MEKGKKHFLKRNLKVTKSDGFWDKPSKKSLRLKMIVHKRRENKEKEKIERKKNACQENEVGTHEEPWI